MRSNSALRAHDLKTSAPALSSSLKHVEHVATSPANSTDRTESPASPEAQPTPPTDSPLPGPHHAGEREGGTQTQKRPNRHLGNLGAPNKIKLFRIFLEFFCRSKFGSLRLSLNSLANILSHLIVCFGQRTSLLYDTICLFGYLLEVQTVGNRLAKTTMRITLLCIGNSFARLKTAKDIQVSSMSTSVHVRHCFRQHLHTSSCTIITSEHNLILIQKRVLHPNLEESVICEELKMRKFLITHRQIEKQKRTVLFINRSANYKKLQCYSYKNASSRIFSQIACTNSKKGIHKHCYSRLPHATALTTNEIYSARKWNTHSR